MNIMEMVDMASKIVTAASIVSALTPTTKDDTAVSFLKKIVNFFALNIIHAAPAAAKEKPYNN